MSIFDDEMKRLDFENILWVIFIGLGILNIVADNYQKEFICSKNKLLENTANKVFLFILVVSFIIYIYFLIRNINAYERASNEEKEIFSIKVFGSIFFIVGVLCLIYFQANQTDFIGSPV